MLVVEGAERNAWPETFAITDIENAHRPPWQIAITDTCCIYLQNSHGEFQIVHNSVLRSFHWVPNQMVDV